LVLSFDYLFENEGSSEGRNAGEDPAQFLHALQSNLTVENPAICSNALLCLHELVEARRVPASLVLQDMVSRVPMVYPCKQAFCWHYFKQYLKE
jgi:hypothetical protein